MATLGTFALGLSRVHAFTKTEALPAGARWVTVDTGNIPLDVRLTTDAAAREIQVTLRTISSTDDIHLTVANAADGSRITLRDTGSGVARFVRSGEVKVVFPPDGAPESSVTINQQTGSLSVDANLDQLVATVNNGAVALGGAVRRLDVTVHRGNIATSSPVAVTESFVAHTESGTASIDFREVPRTTEVLADGDVVVRLPLPGPYRVRALAAEHQGRATVSVPESSTPSAPSVMAHSTHGSVEVATLRQ